VEDPLELDPLNRLSPAKGRILVSVPFLQDPYFRRTVVLLCEHNSKGSFGLVLNRFVDVQVADLMEGLPPMRSRVSIGGPVQSDSLYYLHTFGVRIEQSAEVIDGVYVGGEFEQLRDLLKADATLAKHVRFFVGYSGWGEEQLAKEMAQRSWIVGKTRRTRIMSTAAGDLWATALRDMGGKFAPLANFPEDPSLN
jgi:putative transcriptional regulator